MLLQSILIQYLLREAITNFIGMRDSHILKIVNNGRTFNPNVGVKCYPRQTYGISEEAPDEFKGSHSLMADNGYIYKYDDEDLHSPEEPFSQKKYCSVVGETIDIVTDFKEKYEEGLKNPYTFRKRKGRLSQFSDKNAWMKKVVKLTGFERSDQAREASNRDRQMRINSLTQRTYNNPVALKPLPKQNFMTLDLYTEKAKIRTQRKTFLSRNTRALDLQRSLEVRTPQEDLYVGQRKHLEAESMTNKMASTLPDKEWRSTMSTIRQKYSPDKKSQPRGSTIPRQQQMNFTCADWSKNYKRQENKQEQARDELKEWFNSTCNSAADPWRFRKPRKVDTNSSQEAQD